MQCNNTIYHSYIEPDITRIIKQRIKKYDAIFQVFVNGKIYIERKHYRAVKEKELSSLGSDYIIQRTTPVYGVMQILDVFEGRIEKIRVNTRRKDELLKISSELEALSRIKVDAFNDFIEISALNA